MWVMKWAELLQIRSTGNNANQGISYKSALLWYEWLQATSSPTTSPSTRSSYDLLSPRSGEHLRRTRPRTTSRSNAIVKKMTENVAQVFMGTRIQCAQCHNHPFDRWTMDDYYGFAGLLLAGRQQARSSDPASRFIYNRGGRRASPGLPATNAVMPPTSSSVAEAPA